MHTIDLFGKMNLCMTADVAAAYKSGSQRTRVVTEFWAEQNLYCPNCSSLKLNRLSHNTKAGDFRCPNCEFWFQLKGQKSRIGNSITDGAYAAMMQAIGNDETPNFYFLHYDLATWTIKNLLLIPSFAFPPSAIIKRPPLAATARRAGWIGCNIALNRVPAEARIAIVTTAAVGGAHAPSRVGFCAPAEPSGSVCDEGVADSTRPRVRSPESRILSPAEVREKFHRVKPLKEISIKQRGWTLDVLNIVERVVAERGSVTRSTSSLKEPNCGSQSRAPGEFTNEDIYAHARELEQLHPDNRHIRDKIRQQLQVLRDTGFLAHPGSGKWRLR